MARSTSKSAAPSIMKRHVLDLQVLGHSLQDWMDAPPFTHVVIDGVTLTREQLEDFARAGLDGGATAKAAYLDRLRRG